MIRLAFAGRATLLRRPLQRQKINISKRRSQTTNASETTVEGTTNAQYNSAQAQKASASAPSAPQTIPIPANYWLQPFQTTLRHYTLMNQRRPYVTQFFSTLTIWLIGDLLSQYITSSPPPSETKDGDEPAKDEKVTTFRNAYDPKRTARALIIGGIISIPSYRWFLWLGTVFNYKSKALSISTKVVFNQFTFTPAFGCTFFGSQQVLEHVMKGEWPESEDVVKRIKDTVPTAWVNSWKVWPAVTALSFSVVPVDLRSLFAGVAAVGWQAYISVLNQRALRQEAGKVAGVDEKQVSTKITARGEEKTNANANVPARC